MQDLLALQGDILRSYRSLPTWVQVWVAWLVGINASSMGRRDHEAGRLTARAFVAWFVPSAIASILIRGLGNANALSHLVVYPVLIVALVRRARADDASAEERRFAWLVIVTNAISTAFDIVDAAHFARGERGAVRAERPASGEA